MLHNSMDFCRNLTAQRKTRRSWQKVSFSCLLVALNLNRVVIGNEARPSKTRKKAPDIALLSATLNLLLGENPQMNAGQDWAKGAASATPPCQIKLQDVDWALIGGLNSSHHPAIKAMYDRRAFTDEAWANIEPTMQRLSADFREDPTDSAAALPPLLGDEDCTDTDDDAEDDKGKQNIQMNLLLCLCPCLFCDGWPSKACHWCMDSDSSLMATTPTLA